MFNRRDYQYLSYFSNVSYNFTWRSIVSNGNYANYSILVILIEGQSRFNQSLEIFCKRPSYHFEGNVRRKHRLINYLQNAISYDNTCIFQFICHHLGIYYLFRGKSKLYLNSSLNLLQIKCKIKMHILLYCPTIL